MAAVVVAPARDGGAQGVCRHIKWFTRKVSNSGPVSVQFSVPVSERDALAEWLARPNVAQPTVTNARAMAELAELVASFVSTLAGPRRGPNAIAVDIRLPPGDCTYIQQTPVNLNDTRAPIPMILAYSGIRLDSKGDSIWLQSQLVEVLAHELVHLYQFWPFDSPPALVHAPTAADGSVWKAMSHEIAATIIHRCVRRALAPYTTLEEIDALLWRDQREFWLRAHEAAPELAYPYVGAAFLGRVYAIEAADAESGFPLFRDKRALETATTTCARQFDHPGEHGAVAGEHQSRAAASLEKVRVQGGPRLYFEAHAYDPQSLAADQLGAPRGGATP
jgi:hypothetical protein